MWVPKIYLFLGFLRGELLQFSIMLGDVIGKLFDDDLDPFFVLLNGADFLMKLVLLSLQFLSEVISLIEAGDYTKGFGVTDPFCSFKPVSLV